MICPLLLPLVGNRLRVAPGYDFAGFANPAAAVSTAQRIFGSGK